MVDAAGWIVLLSVIVQAVAAALALRLNWVHGKRWAWTLISVAITLMTIRRGLVLYRITVLDDPATTFAEAEEAIDFVAANISLLVSLLMLAGVAMIQPIFREVARAERVLRLERDEYKHTVDERAREFGIARRIQDTLLPKGPQLTDTFEVAGSSHPAAETGGDYFDHFQLPDGALLIVIADVCGHGLGPALIMSEARTLVRTIAGTEPDPGHLLCRLNSRIAEDTDDAEKYFITVFIATFRPEQRRLVYASAGHPGYLLPPSGGVITLDSPHPPVGIFADMRYESSSVEVDPGSMLFLTTDGVTEAESPKGELFGIERALAVVRGDRDKPASELVHSLHERVNEFSSGRRHDDITTAIVKLLPDNAVRQDGVG